MGDDQKVDKFDDGWKCRGARWLVAQRQLRAIMELTHQPPNGETTKAHNR